MLGGRLVQRRNTAGYVVHADFKDVGTRKRTTWLRNRQVCTVGFTGCFAGGRGLLVSGAAEDADQGMGNREVGHNGGEPAGAVLPIDGGGAKAI